MKRSFKASWRAPAPRGGAAGEDPRRALRHAPLAAIHLNRPHAVLVRNVVRVGKGAGGINLGFDPSAPVVVIYRGGHRSRIAADLLRSRGLTNVANLTGGIDAWIDVGLPTIGEDSPRTVRLAPRASRLTLSPRRSAMSSSGRTQPGLLRVSGRC